MMREGDDASASFLVDGEDIFGPSQLYNKEEEEYYTEENRVNDGADDELEEYIDDGDSAMPAEFYEQFDSFLCRPAPKVAQFAAASASHPALPRHVSPLQRQHNKVKLPDISKTKQGSNDEKMMRSRSLPNTSTAKSSGYGTKKSSSRSANLDPSLVEEAFNYANKLSLANAQLAQMETSLTEQQHVTESRSAPQTAQHKTENRNNNQRPPRARQSKGSKSNSKLVRKLRSKTREQSERESSFDTSISDTTDTKSSFDMAALVENFEKGIALQELRAALNESQASVQKSQNYIRNITKEFSQRR